MITNLNVFARKKSCLIEVLSRRLPRGTGENNEKDQDNSCLGRDSNKPPP
jgi:hypothetical protein